MSARCFRPPNSQRARVMVWRRARRTGNAPTISWRWPHLRCAPSNADRQGVFMNIQNKLALLSALGGAAIAVTVILAAAMLGLFPRSEEHTSELQSQFHLV